MPFQFSLLLMYLEFSKWIPIHIIKIFSKSSQFIPISNALTSFPHLNAFFFFFWPSLLGNLIAQLANVCATPRKMHSPPAFPRGKLYAKRKWQEVRASGAGKCEEIHSTEAETVWNNYIAQIEGVPGGRGYPKEGGCWAIYIQTHTHRTIGAGEKHFPFSIFRSEPQKLLPDGRQGLKCSKSTNNFIIMQGECGLGAVAYRGGQSSPEGGPPTG